MKTGRQLVRRHRFLKTAGPRACGPNPRKGAFVTRKQRQKRMKNNRSTHLTVIVCLLLSLALCFSGCSLFGSGGGDIADELRDKLSGMSQSSSDEPSQSSEGSGETGEELNGDIVWEDGDIAAAGYLAYQYESSDELTVNTQLYRSRYSFADGHADEVQGGGYEYYYIIPRFSGCNIVVESLDSDGETVLEQIYESGAAASPILLNANYSDIIPNTRVTVTCGETSVSFSPSLSLRGEGEVMNPLPDGIKDITVSPLCTYSLDTPDLDSWPSSLADDRPVIISILESFGPFNSDYLNASPADMLGSVSILAQAFISAEPEKLCYQNGHYFVMNEDTVNGFIRSMWAKEDNDIEYLDGNELIRYDAANREYSFADLGPLMLNEYECYDFYDRGDGTATLMLKCWVRESSFSEALSPSSVYVIDLVRNDTANALTAWRVSDYSCITLSAPLSGTPLDINGDWEMLMPLEDDSYAVYHLTLSEDGSAEFYYGWYLSEIAGSYTGSYVYDGNNSTLTLELSLDHTVMEDAAESLTMVYSVSFDGAQLVMDHLDGDFILSEDTQLVMYPTEQYD